MVPAAGRTGKVEPLMTGYEISPRLSEYGAPFDHPPFIHHTVFAWTNPTLWILSGQDLLDHIDKEEMYANPSAKGTELYTRREIPVQQLVLFSLGLTIEKVSGESLRTLANTQFVRAAGNEAHFFGMTITALSGIAHSAIRQSARRLSESDHAL